MKKQKKAGILSILPPLLLTLMFFLYLLANPLNGDYLRYVRSDTPAGIYCADFRLSLGNKVHSAVIYAEEWQNGQCIGSTPLVIDDTTESVTILLTPRTKENGTAEGFTVQVDAGESAASLLTYFAFPAGASGWSFSSYEKNEKLEVKPGSRLILANLTADFGSGVLSQSCRNLTANPELLESMECCIVLRAEFSENDEVAAETDTVSCYKHPIGSRSSDGV